MFRRRSSPVSVAERLELNGPQVVTGILADPRTPGYEIIELNGTRFASLPEQCVSDAGVRAGVELDSEQLDRLSEAADIEAAWRVSVRLLTARPRSAFEMKRALQDRGHRDAPIDRVIERLIAGGLVDDREYARHFASIRFQKGHGSTRIVADLRARGVDSQLAKQVVDEVLQTEEIDPLDRARELGAKRLGQLKHLPDETRRRRVLAYLSRRGYHGWEVRQAIDRLMDSG